MNTDIESGRKYVKFLGYFFATLVILNLLFFSFRIINGAIFWTIIAFSALFAFKGLPMIKKKYGLK